MKYQFVILLLSAVITVGFTGCMDSGRNTVVNDVQPYTEISLLIKSHPSYPFEKDWWIWKKLTERTNIKFNITAVENTNYMETMDIVLASGNMPDIVAVEEVETANKFGLQGILLDFRKYLDRMSSFKTWIQNYPDYYKRDIAADGGVYLLPTEGMGETERKAWLFRQDILAENKLKVPESYAELYQVLKRLKEIYPSSYPLTLRLGLTNFEYITPQWNARSGYYYDGTSQKWSYGQIENNYRDMVLYFKKLYQESLIPPDFPTLNTKQWENEVASGNVFFTVDYINRIDFFNTALGKENPGFKLCFMAPPKGDNGGSHQFGYSPRLSQTFVVSNRSKNVDAVLRFIDYLYSEEGRDLVSWGVKDETYVIENGERKFIDVNEMAELRSKYGISTVGTYLWYDYNSHISLFSDQLKNAISKSRDYDIEPSIAPPFTNDEYDHIINAYEEKIDKYAEQQITKFIMGIRDIEEWDKYIKEIRSMGLDLMLETYDTAYRRMLIAAQ